MAMRCTFFTVQSNRTGAGRIEPCSAVLHRRLFIEPSPVQEPLHQAHDHADDDGDQDAGNNGEIKAAAFALDPDVARQAAQETEPVPREINDHADEHHDKPKNNDVFSCRRVQLHKGSKPTAQCLRQGLAGSCA